MARPKKERPNPTIRAVCITHLATAQGTFAPGDTVDVDITEADQLVKMGAIRLENESRQEKIESEMEREKLDAAPRIPEKNHVEGDEID